MPDIDWAKLAPRISPYIASMSLGPTIVASHDGDNLMVALDYSPPSTPAVWEVPAEKQNAVLTIRYQQANSDSAEGQSHLDSVSCDLTYGFGGYIFPTDDGMSVTVGTVSHIDIDLHVAGVSVASASADVVSAQTTAIYTITQDSSGRYDVTLASPVIEDDSEELDTQTLTDRGLTILSSPDDLHNKAMAGLSSGTAGLAYPLACLLNGEED